MAEKGPDVAYREAVLTLKETEPEKIAERTGAEADDRTVCIDYFDRRYTIDVVTSSFIPDGLPNVERILILHYLTSKGGNGSRGGLVGYRSLRNGMFYYQPFRGRTVERLLPVFGNSPAKLIDAAKVLNGTPGTYGDASVRFRPFPMIDTVVVLHLGDEELKPEMTYLFNESIVKYLSLEDIALLGGVIAGKLIKAVR